MDKLLPCPYCGGEAWIPEDQDRFAPFGWASCLNCECDGPPAEDSNDVAAIIAAWNRREEVDNPYLERAYDIWNKVYYGDNDNLVLNITRMHDLLFEEASSYQWPDSMFIREAKPETVNGWVSVEKGLPKDSAPVLTWSRRNGLEVAHTDCDPWGGVRWESDCTGDSLDYAPTDWQPITPPEGE